MSAEGGGEFVPENTERVRLLEHDSDDDDGGQEVNRTQPFEPGVTSTPYHGGETIEMQMLQHEQTGLPDTSYAETSRKLTDEELTRLNALRDQNTKVLPDNAIPLVPHDLRQKEIERVREFIKSRYRSAKVNDLVIRYSDKGKIVALGPKQGETKIMLEDGSGFRKDFLNKSFFKKILGQKTEDVIVEDRDTIREMKQRLTEAEKQLQQVETLSLQREKEKREVEVLRSKIEQTATKIDSIQDKEGSNLESEAELCRLKQLKKNYQTDLENKKKELDSRAKEAKNREKEQAKVDRLRASLAAKESETNAIEKRLNQTKPLDDLKEQESDLQRQNEKDQKIIQDEDASPSDKEVAEGRVAERNEEIARLQTQIAEREIERPLLERVKDIFKQYGVTLTAILLAAGSTISAVIGVLTKGLKATGKALGNGLKDIAAKLGSLLPGLIGSIVSFLFKTAGQVVGFLAEHTWLLILATVAFLFEKYFKKQRYPAGLWGGTPTLPPNH